MAILPALEKACAAYLLCDAALLITASSPNIAEALGTLEAPLVGRQLLDAIPALLPYHEQIQAVQAGTAAQVVAEQIKLRHCDGSTCMITVHVLPFNEALLIYIQEAHNQMRLQEHIQQQYNELHRLHAQLATRNEELLHRSQQTAELLSLVVHEVESRLSSIAESIGLLLDQDTRYGKQDQQATLRLLQHEVAQAVDLIHQAIDWQEVATAGVTTRYPVELDLLVQQVVQAFQPYAAQRSVRLLYDRDGAAEQTFEPLLVVMGNASMLQQAVTHLISGSLRYATAGCTLVLRLKKLLHDLPALEPPLEPLYNWCLLEIEDDGPGIPAEQLAQITARAGTQGALLGFAVAQQAIQQHGGRLQIGSHPSTGTLMQVYLPCEPDGAAGYC